MWERVGQLMLLIEKLLLKLVNIKRGVATVEMEASALFAVAQYRGAEMGAMFTISDSLAELQWSPKFHFKKTRGGLETLYKVALCEDFWGIPPAEPSQFRSDIFKQTPPIFTFCEIVRNSLGAKCLGMVFFRNFEGIFEIQNQSAVGNAEVRTNLFEKIPSAYGGFLLSVFFGLVGVF